MSLPSPEILVSMTYYRRCIPSRESLLLGTTKMDLHSVRVTGFVHHAAWIWAFSNLNMTKKGIIPPFQRAPVSVLAGGMWPKGVNVGFGEWEIAVKYLSGISLLPLRRLLVVRDRCAARSAPEAASGCEGTCDRR